MDLALTPGEHVLRGDVANRAVQANVVVMLGVALHQTQGIFQRQGRSRPDALSLERFVPSFALAVRLRIVGRSSHVGHARDPNELFEVLGDELRSVVGDDSWPRLRVKFLGSFQDDLNVRLGHRLPQIPVHDVPAAAVQNAAHVVERPADVDVRHVNVPVMMSGQPERRPARM